MYTTTLNVKGFRSEPNQVIFRYLARLSNYVIGKPQERQETTEIFSYFLLLPSTNHGKLYFCYFASL